MLTLYTGFGGRRIQKKYCRIHHANVSAIVEVILPKWPPFLTYYATCLSKYETEKRHCPVYISFMGNIIQIVHCYAHHTIVGTIWLAVVAIRSK